MSNDGLVLSGPIDLSSSTAYDGFVSKSLHQEEYCSPENQINKTEKHNEMDFYRIQDGKRKQPDYIIVFRENGKVEYMEEAKKAQEQWGGLPIVIIDRDKCLEAEKQKVEEMIEGYEEGDKSLAGQIYQKVRNNRVTRGSFCSDIDIEKYKEEAEKQIHEEEKEKRGQKQTQNEKMKEKPVDIEDLEENYDKVTPQERKDEVSKIKRIKAKIQEIIEQKEGGKDGRE